MKLNRIRRFSDTVTVSCGGKQLTLRVDADLPTLVSTLRSVQALFALPCGSDASDLGQGLQEVFEGIFGSQQAERCIDLYEGHWLEMLDELLPYLLQRVIPLAEKVSAKRCRELVRLGRKRRRLRK